MKNLLAAIAAAFAVTAAAQDSGPGDVLGALGKFGGEQQFLPVEEAFRSAVTAPSPRRLQVSFKVAENYYLYRDKIRVRSLRDDVQLAPLQLPPADKIGDPYFGDVWIYDRDVTVTAALDATVDSLPLELTYQGCARDGVCYVPVTERWTLAPGDGVAVRNAGANVYSGSVDVYSDGSDVQNDGSFFLYLLSAFGAGVLLTFTPCVLPMVPVVSAVVAGQGGGRARGGLLAVVYVLGTAAAYAAAGAVAGATGDQLQAFFQHEFFLIAAAAFFAAMALAMFGVFHLQMPAVVQSRLSAAGRSGGTFAGVFVLGALSALIVGACVSPVLVSVLGVALRTADPLLGAALMASMALGMGLILIAAGFGVGIAVRRFGAWLDTVKRGFGVALLAVAVYLLGAIPEVPVQLLWGALFITVGVAALRGRIFPAAGGAQVAAKSIGVFFLVWGAAATAGGFAGNRNPLQPVAVLFTDKTVTAGQSLTITDTAALENVIAAAAESGKKLAVYYHADWCVDCARLERTFTDAAVAQTLRSEFVFAEVDLSDSFDPGTRALRRQFAVFGPPAVLLFNADGVLMRRVYGYRGAAEFGEILRAL